MHYWQGFDNLNSIKDTEEYIYATKTHTKAKLSFEVRSINDLDINEIDALLSDNNINVVDFSLSIANYIDDYAKTKIFDRIKYSEFAENTNKRIIEFNF